FFIVEVLRHLAETQQIVARDGRWTASVAEDAIGVPEGVRDVVGRRLTRLSEEANRVLAIAATIGGEFDVATLQLVAGMSAAEVLDAVDEASQATLVRDVDAAAGKFAFAHALVRATIYDELSSAQRIRLHWKIATAIADRYRDDLAPHLDDLAFHGCEGALV